MRAVIYARTSSSGYQADRQNTSRQVEDLKKYCEFANYKVVKIFSEHESGLVKPTERQVLVEAVEFCKSNHIDILLVSELSRLNRGSVFDTMAFIKDLMDNGINLYSQKEQFTLLDNDGKPSIFAPILLSCLSLANSLELESIKFRLNSGRQQAIAQGVKMGRPVGSTMDKEKKEAKYADAIRFIRKNADRLSVREMATMCDLSPMTIQRLKKEFL